MAKSNKRSNGRVAEMDEPLGQGSGEEFVEGLMDGDEGEQTASEVQDVENHTDGEAGEVVGEEMDAKGDAPPAPAVTTEVVKLDIELPPDIAKLSEDDPRRRAFILTAKLKKMRLAQQEERVAVKAVKQEAAQKKLDIRAQREAEREARKAERAAKANQPRERKAAAKKEAEPITSAEQLFKAHPTALSIYQGWLLPLIAEQGADAIFEASINKIAKAQGLSRPSAKNGLAGLVRKGVLEVVARGMNTPTTYRFHDVFATGQYEAPTHIASTSEAGETAEPEQETVEEEVA